MYVGDFKISLSVASNCTDTDFTYKLTDLFPASEGGYDVIITDSIVRMRWRNDPRIPSPMSPGSFYTVTSTSWPVCYIVSKNHQLRLAISSSNSPRFSANPNTGQLLNATHTLAPLIALNSIAIGKNSFVSVPLVDPSQLPNNVL